MLNERLQILVTAEQRRALEHEAQRRQTSVGRVIRDAVEAALGGVAQDDRLAAVDEIRALTGSPPPGGTSAGDGPVAATLRHLVP